MTSKEFLATFGYLAGAPDGVARLRRLVLQLAVDGALLPSGDRHAEAGGAALREVQLARLCESITDGDHSAPPKAEAGIPFVTITNINKKTRSLDFSNTAKVPHAYYEGLKEARKPRRGDILYTVTGSFGIPVLIDSGTEFCFQRHIALVRPKPDVNPRWLYYALMSPAAYAQADRGATGTAQRTVGLKTLRAIRLREPSRPNQDRIVRAIDELFALCDALEAEESRLRNLRATTARSALHDLVTGNSSLSRAVTLLDEHLGLTLAPGEGAADVVAQLRTAVIDMAVTGRLAAQDTADSPAAELLERIAERRADLVDSGQMTGKGLMKRSASSVGDGAYPAGWVGVQAGVFFHLEYGKGLPRARRDESAQFPVMGANGAMGRCSEPLIDGPCLVVGRKGSAGAINFVEGPCWPTDVTYFVRTVADENLRFIELVLQAMRLPGLARGIKPGLDRNEVHLCSVGVPPTEEQARIVARVDELMTLCVELEIVLGDERRLAAELAESVVGALLAQPA